MSPLASHVPLDRDDTRKLLREALAAIDGLERACLPEDDPLAETPQVAVLVNRAQVLAFVDIARLGLLNVAGECGFQERELTGADL